MVKKNNEIDLIKLAKNGDEIATEELLNKYKPLVCKLARGYFLVGADNDDTIQEGMIGLYKALISFDEKRDASFSTFAHICVKRQIQNAVKKYNSKKNKVFYTSQRNVVNNLDDEEEFEFGISNEPNPEENLIGKENEKIIQSEIKEKLTFLEKKILLYYLDGLSYLEIAQRLDISKKSVDNGLIRIRKKLSHLLEL